MEIQSAFAAGVQGFQKASEEASQAAQGIVRETSGIDESNQTAQSSNASETLGSPQLPDLNQEIVNLKVAEHQAKAAAEVIKSADDSLGTILDVTA